MKGLLQVLAVMIGFLVASGEIARRWGDPRFIPLALDDLVVAAALFWSAWRARNHGPAPLVAAWGLYSGLMLMLLTINANYLINDIPKAGRVFYSVILAAMLGLGLWATWRSLRLTEDKAEF
jgi:predicted lysophospholipase L1 biosynthesis ABC-type transport system permease subunit